MNIYRRRSFKCLAEKSKKNLQEKKILDHAQCRMQPTTFYSEFHPGAIFGIRYDIELRIDQQGASTSPPNPAGNTVSCHTEEVIAPTQGIGPHLSGVVGTSTRRFVLRSCSSVSQLGPPAACLLQAGGTNGEAKKYKVSKTFSWPICT